MTTPEQPANTPAQPAEVPDKWQQQLNHWQDLAKEHRTSANHLRAATNNCFLIGAAGLITFGVATQMETDSRELFELGGGIGMAFAVPGVLQLRSARREKNLATEALDRVRTLEVHQIEMDQAAAYNLDQATSSRALAAQVGDYLIQSGELRRLISPATDHTDEQQPSAAVLPPSLPVDGVDRPPTM